MIFCTIKKVKNLLATDDTYDFEDINRSIIYLVNYVMEYLLIPGQIENWIIFVDFDGIGVTDLGDFQKIISAFSKRRGRVFKNFFVNVGTILRLSIKAYAKMVSSVAKKSIILGNNELYKVTELISPDNLEQKYGGKAPNVTPGGNNLFPPIMPNANYALNGETLNIVSPETYKNICMGNNRPYVICPEYEKIWEEEKYNEEMNKKKKNEEKKEKIFLIQRNITANNEKVKNSTDMGFDKLNKNEFNKKRLLSDNKLFVKNDMDEIDEFLKEFEDINNLDSFEEKKYNTPTKINIQEINSFFEFIKQNPDFF